jgi:hypothetical protein
MALVHGEQVLELGEQLLGDIGCPSELAKVRKDSPLRFNVALAVSDVALRHLQFGLAVHVERLTPESEA